MAVRSSNDFKIKSLLSLINFTSKVIWNFKIMCQIMGTLVTLEFVKIMGFRF